MKKADLMNRSLEDYFRIRFENKIALRPRREDCHLAAATRLLAKRSELEAVDKELQNHKEWFKSKLAEIAAGRSALEEQENDLKKQMIKYEKFLQDNDSKRHRGERKIEEERKLQAKKDIEIVQLKEMLRRLENTKYMMQIAVDKNKKFRDFMQKAVDSDPDVEEINDLLSRCDVLSATKQVLNDRDQQDILKLDSEMLNILSVSESLSTTVLRLNNRISELHLEYDRARNSAAATENNWNRIKNTAAKKTLLLGRVKMAVHNLYQLCSRYHEARALDQEEVVEHTEPAEQLEKIADVLQDIASVYRECKRVRRAAMKTNQGVKSAMTL